MQQLCLDTGAVKAVFPSASSASRRFPATRANRILQICEGARKGLRSEGGFGWRFVGSSSVQLLYGERRCDGRAVEQLDLPTGQVMREFKSMREASAKTKVARVAIKMVCEGKGIDPDAGGFFWRFKGDPQLPWATRTNAQFKPVEQLSFETNEVIAEFVSVAEAKKIHGKGVSIQQVCNDGFVSAAGYFWRWKGSPNTPQRHRDGRGGKAASGWDS